MTEEARQLIHKKQTEEIYMGIGKFSVEFEQMIHQMGAGIVIMLSVGGLQNQRLAHIVTADLTADPMMGIFKSMVIEILKPQGKEETIFKAIMKDIKEMIATRNKVIHSAWYVGWGGSEDTDYSVAKGIKITKTSNAVEHRSLDYTSADFDAISSKCKQLREFILGITHITINHGSLSKNFDISEEGIIRI